MAWNVAAYGITAAVLLLAAAGVFGMVQACRALKRIDSAVERLSDETVATLMECRLLIKETHHLSVEARHTLEGLSSLAEGARALGEATHLAAKGITCATAKVSPELVELGHSLWHWWRNKRSGAS